MPGPFSRAQSGVYIAQQVEDTIGGSSRVLDLHHEAALPEYSRVSAAPAHYAREAACHGFKHCVRHAVAAREMAEHVA